MSDEIEEAILGSAKKESGLPEIIIIDNICERYGWTFDEFDEQFERHPRRFAELFTLMDAQGRARNKATEKSARQESDERRRRLGLIP